MGIRNGLFWQNYFIDIFIPQIDAFKECLLSKIFPSFDNIEHEAEKIEEKEYERLINSPVVDDNSNGAVLAERASEKGKVYYLLMSTMKNGVLHLFCVGLYHHFEQQLFLFYKKEILNIPEEGNRELLKWGKLLERFKNKGITLKDLPSYQDINILRLICNTVKHVEGKSEEELRKIKPNFFRFENLTYSVVGDDLKISIDDFEHYIDTVKNFWKELGGKIIDND